MNNTNLPSEIQRDLKRLELLPYISRASAHKRADDAIPYFKTQSNGKNSSGSKAKYGPLKFSSDDSSVKLQKQQVEWIFEWNPEVNNPEEAVEFVIERQKPAVDWNEIFQSLVELYCATPFEYDWRSRALSKVIDMFTKDALPDAMAIMNAELDGTSYPFQTVQLGQAGGVKFIHKNKLFKLIGRKTITEIYDGDYVAAMKVPQREISSINFLLSLNKPGLHLPLTVIVSYGCFAVVVSALIPIDNKTIVYGSNDGGSTVHDDSEPFRQMMEEIGTLLNLKKHEIKSSGKWLYTAGDVEGHVGHDHRNYLIDVARLSPSMVPVSDSQEWLYKLFKPQFVAVWPVALSADAFSKFENLNYPSLVEASQIEIEQATTHLANIVVPQLAEQLDNDVTVSDFNAIKQKFEQTGVNLRFMNTVFKHIQRNKRVKYLLLLNMAARALKSDVLHILQTHDKSSYVRSLNDIKKLIKDVYKLDINDIWHELSSIANDDLSVNQDLIQTITKLSGITLVISESNQVSIGSVQPIVRKIAPPTPLSMEQLEGLVKDYERNYPTAQLLIEIKERLAEAYIAAGRFDKALVMNEQVLKHHQTNLGATHTRTLATLHHIASIYHSKGDYETSRHQYEELLDVIDKNLKLGNVHRLVVMSNLALIYSDQGQYELALKTYEEAMNYYSQNQMEHPIILTITNNLAVVHDNLGHYEEALKLHEQTYKNHFNIFGETPGLISTINNIGYIYSKQKKLEEAKKYYEKAYDLSCSLLGPKNIISLTGLNNIATILNKMEYYEDALKYYEEVLEGETEFYGFDNPTTLITRHNIANVLKELGDPKNALNIYKEIVAVRRRALGEDHIDTITTKNNIALLYYDTERYQEALKCSLAVLESCQRAFGDKAHTITASTIDNIANIYAKLSDDEESRNWFSLVLKLEQELYGEHSPEALVTMSKIGLAHENLENYDEALRHYNTVYDLKKEKLGQNHFSTMMAWRDIADVYTHQGKYEEALVIYRTVLSFVEGSSDASLEDIVETKHDLAHLFLKMQRHEDALELLQQTLEGDSELREEDDPEIFETMDSIANTLFDLERYGEAAKQFEKVIQLREEHLGEDHADTLDSMAGLALTYRKLQQYDKAIAVFKTALARQKRSKKSMEDIMDNKNQLALTYFKKEKLKEALELYEQVLNYREASGADPADIQKTKEKIKEINEKLDKGKTNSFEP